MDLGSHAEGFQTVLALDSFDAPTEAFEKNFPDTDLKTAGIFGFKNFE